MTDLALGLSGTDAARLRALAGSAERAYAAAAKAEARYALALSEMEAFAQECTVGSRSSRDSDMLRRTVASELAVPLRESDRSIQSQMHDAHSFVSEYPATFALLWTGRIGRTHVAIVTRAGGQLPTEARAAFDAYAADVCLSTSTVRARGVLQACAERLHPRSPTERHHDARTARAVWVQVVGDGMSRLTADLPSVLGEGIHDRLERMATLWVDARTSARARVEDADALGATADDGDTALAVDGRTKDQVRADILADLLLTGGPDVDPTADGDGHGEFGAIRGHVQVVVSATTLLGADEHPADLAGVAPIDAATAREVAGNCGGLTRILVHPVSGQVLATDHYRPTLDLSRRLKARDRHCRFPGCRVPSLRCEMDHTHDWALGGPTCLANLACLCQRHHTMKQFTPWKVRQLGNGKLEWTSPTGRVYVDEPPRPLVFFSPAAGPPPPF